jgi:hypothetical protein
VTRLTPRSSFAPASPARQQLPVLPPDSVSVPSCASPTAYGTHPTAAESPDFGLTNDLLSPGVVASPAAASSRLARLLDRVAGWLKKISGPVVLGDPCPVCESHFCAEVHPEIPTARPCAGRKWEGQCCDEGGIWVELTKRDETGGCPNSRLHLVANKKVKPGPATVHQFKGVPMPSQ